jgi:hypothetical protein
LQVFNQSSFFQIDCINFIIKKKWNEKLKGKNKIKLFFLGQGMQKYGFCDKWSVKVLLFCKGLNQPSLLLTLVQSQVETNFSFLKSSFKIRHVYLICFSSQFAFEVLLKSFLILQTRVSL